MRDLHKNPSMIIMIGILFTFLCSNVNGQKSNHSSLLAGAYKVNITPGKPIPMSGYGGRNEPFKGVHDSLYVTATVFSDASQKSVIITADLIGFSHEFCESTIGKIESELGIKEEFILLSANHNHGGPRNKTYGENTNPDVEKYVIEVQHKILDAVNIANQNLQPAMIGVGIGSCNMNINRRARFADGNVWLGRNPDGPCDHDVAVIRLDDLNRNPIALHVNWPCHGTASGQKNYKITGDWPGLTARYVEKEFDKNVVIAVTAGASADINPIYGPNDNFREIESLGMLVGEEVLRITSTIQTFPNGNIEAYKMKVMANGKEPFESRSPDQKLVSAQKVPINLSAMKIGNIVFAGVSGELMTEIGMRIKDESPYKNTVIITHCNGASGYLCTDQAYPEGGYEAMVSKVMPGTEYLISNNLKEMIQRFR
jgi:hypothetical protein